jgi:hypothetical protein
MYWAWRPAFVAEVRKILGEDAVILANSAGAVSDPSLSGITIEMESCVGRLSGGISTDVAIHNTYRFTFLRVILLWQGGRRRCSIALMR